MHHARVRGMGSSQGINTSTVCPILATASLNVVNHQSDGTCKLACWLTVNTSNHTYAFSERLLSASTTSTNVNFHACDTNTVASFTSRGCVFLSMSAYDVLTCSVAGLTIPKHTSFVVMRSNGMSTYCTVVGLPSPSLPASFIACVKFNIPWSDTVVITGRYFSVWLAVRNPPPPSIENSKSEKNNYSTDRWRRSRLSVSLIVVLPRLQVVVQVLVLV
mmetsp:Transcript_1414/g.3043  ORF Transcript_1414/g.3043 Transcript_1414/m.3043 type:complete len:218 (-) Transcript_1414:795-1448(-)